MKYLSDIFSQTLTVFNTRMFVTFMIVLSTGSISCSQGAQHSGKFKKIMTNQPGVMHTSKGRSPLECGRICLSNQICTGFTFTSDEKKCQFYSLTTFELSTNIQATPVYQLASVKAKCKAYAQIDFETMLLDGNYYCILVVNSLQTSGIEAANYCQRLDSTLIALETVNKINDFQNILKGGGRFESRYWVGLDDTQQEGKFVWSKTGAEIGHDNEVWDPNQPNGQEDQNCCLIEGNRLLQDKTCSMSAFFACELNLEAKGNPAPKSFPSSA